MLVWLEEQVFILLEKSRNWDPLRRKLLLLFIKVYSFIDATFINREYYHQPKNNFKT